MSNASVALGDVRRPPTTALELHERIGSSLPPLLLARPAEPFPTLPAWYRARFAVKRTIDVVVAALGLVALVPLIVVVAIAIKVSDGGPVVFRQERVGRNGRRFVIYKFRTMARDAETRLAALRTSNRREGPLFKLSDDPRVTSVGRVLRATSIDEVPQLVNVLLGSMSLVGPRPALPSEVAQFDPQLLARLKVLPGITGLWQVRGREDPSFESYRRYDLAYIERWSLWLDFRILSATIVAVLRRPVLMAFRGFSASEAAVLD